VIATQLRKACITQVDKRKVQSDTPKQIVLGARRIESLAKSSLKTFADVDFSEWSRLISFASIGHLYIPNRNGGCTSGDLKTAGVIHSTSADDWYVVADLSCGVLDPLPRTVVCGYSFGLSLRQQCQDN
jgi:hypothetical protein